MTQLPSPGWYPDPSSPVTHVRWWDGRQWTGWTQPTGASDGRTDDGELLAGWWQRVGQYLLDSLLVTLVAAVVSAPYTVWWIQHEWPRLRDALEQSARTGNPFDQGQFNSTVFPLTVTFGLVAAVVFCGYSALLLRRRSQTVGMRAQHLHVRTVEHAEGPLAWSVIARRLIAQQAAALVYLPFVPLGYQTAAIVGNVAGMYVLLDVLWPLWDPRNQTLHDKFAGTLLVRRP